MLQNIGMLCFDQQKMDAAEDALKESLAAYVVSCGSNDLRVAGSMALLARILCAKAKPSEAEPVARQAVELFHAKKSDRWIAYYAEVVLGRSLANQKKYVDAEPPLVSGCTGMGNQLAAIPVDNHVFLKEGMQSLIEVYNATGRTKDAAGWEEKLASLEQPTQATSKK
jgi:hypothetical protein